MATRRHKLMHSFSVAALGVLLAGAGTIADGNATLSFSGTPVFNTAAGDGSFITDVGAVDQLYKYNWYYRTPLNNQNSMMSKSDVPVEQYNGNTAIFTWTNAGPAAPGDEVFDALLTVHLQDGPDPAHCLVTHSLMVRNRSSVTRTFQFFNLIDMDLSGSPLDDTSEGSDFSQATGARFALDEPSGRSGECVGLGATRWEVGSGSSLRAKLSAGGQDLSNSVAPFTGDGAVAFQWTLTLAPGEARVIYGGFGVGESVPCPADLDRNGFVNGDDYDAFLFYFTWGDPHADFDHNGFANGDDFDLFVERFEIGC